VAARVVKYVELLKRRLSDTERATAEQARLAKKARSAQEDAERRNEELRAELDAVRTEAKASQELVAYHMDLANNTLSAINGGLPSCGLAMPGPRAKTPPSVLSEDDEKFLFGNIDVEMLVDLPDALNKQRTPTPERPPTPEKGLPKLTDEDLKALYNSSANRRLDGACTTNIKDAYYKDNPTNQKRGRAGMLRPGIRECAASSDCERCRDLVASNTSDAAMQLFA
jgi:hypothetical protein